MQKVSRVSQRINGKLDFQSNFKYFASFRVFAYLLRRGIENYTIGGCSVCFWRGM